MNRMIEGPSGVGAEETDKITLTGSQGTSKFLLPRVDPAGSPFHGNQEGSYEAEKGATILCIQCHRRGPPLLYSPG